MKNITTHTGVLKVLTRLPSRSNGNPRYEVMLDGYAAKTMVDANDTYGIVDLDGVVVKAEIGTHYD